MINAETLNAETFNADMIKAIQDGIADNSAAMIQSVNRLIHRLSLLLPMR
jgi:hypothetical protein